MMVLHNCNNKLCVRLDHLRIGTHKENMDDMARVGHVNRKLTDDQASLVRASSESVSELARRFGVDPVVIVNIRSGKTYRYAKVRPAKPNERAA